MMLQPTEWRLRLTKNEQIHPKPQDYITVAASRSSSGLLYFLVVSTVADGCSTDVCAYAFLEGCWLWGGANSTPQTASLLTSGGEEMFFGTAYFFNQSFATLHDTVLSEHRRYDIFPYSYNKSRPSPLTVAAVFDERPVTFGGVGGRLFWQNGAWNDERADSPTRGLKCYARTADDATPSGRHEPSRHGGTAAIEMTTYAFTYEHINTVLDARVELSV